MGTKKRAIVVYSRARKNDDQHATRVEELFSIVIETRRVVARLFDVDVVVDCDCAHTKKPFRIQNTIVFSFVFWDALFAARDRARDGRLEEKDHEHHRPPKGFYRCGERCGQGIGKTETDDTKSADFCSKKKKRNASRSAAQRTFFPDGTNGCTERRAVESRGGNERCERKRDGEANGIEKS